MSRKSSTGSRTTVTEGKEEVTRVLLLGPRGSGKTCFLYKSYFKYGTDGPNTEFNVIPTPTYNVEVIPYHSYKFELWDFAEISASLNHINENTRVILYMVDCIEASKEAVLAKGKENMTWLLENFGKILENTIIITIANKQSESAMDIQDIGNSWVNDKKLIGLLRGHDWRIFPCNALTGDGIDTLFDYITRKLQSRQSGSSSSRSSGSRRTSSIVTLDPTVRLEMDHNELITPWDNLPNPHHLSDREFKLWFYGGRPFLFFDHWCLIRIIYLSITTEKRKKNIIPLLDKQLEIALSQQQDQHYMDLNINQSIQYSETQTLFWIQMVSFALLKSPLLEGENNDFESFLLRCRIQEDCWKDYYTFKLFYSPRASKEFLPPDKKSLPNAFKSSSFALRGSRLNIDYQVL